MKETVYAGPSTGGTVYNGTDPGGTVFDESKFVLKKVDTTVSRDAMTKKMRRLALGYGLVAAASIYEFYAYSGTLAASALLVAAIFGTLAFFAYKVRRGVLLAAMAIYGLHGLILVGYALSSGFGIFLVARPLILRGMLLYNLWNTYGQMSALLELEAM